jgi:hypothetical protein
MKWYNNYKLKIQKHKAAKKQNQINELNKFFETQFDYNKFKTIILD